MNAAELDQVVQGLHTKSDKIRALGRRGVSTADIARYLDIRYQHARNVLVDSGLHPSRHDATVDISAEAEPAQAGKAGSDFAGWIDLGPQGVLRLPATLLESAGIREGAKVHVRLNGDAIEILSPRAALKRAHDLVRGAMPVGISLVNDLIKERRREAKREEGGL
ncbi:MAG TPA: AbrB/MazE/SpoVT family DNA-binding domain-containing protein [Hyphomicrobiales bacterium]|nr:AbrB/MazE/SpoVT family DNA-binding domain-containing protein [Hyphomicrobiales bacterium]